MIETKPQPGTSAFRTMITGIGYVDMRQENSNFWALSRRFSCMLTKTAQIFDKQPLL